MKTQNKKLDFKKKSITELNDGKLYGINGGGSTAACNISLSPASVIAASIISILGSSGTIGASINITTKL